MEQLFGGRILSLFLNHPHREFYVREAARECRLSPASASIKLRDLEKRGLIQRRKERHVVFYQASPTPAFKAIKVAKTVQKIVSSGFLKTVEENSSGVSALLLYGSAAIGEDDEESDYDFAVIAAACNSTKIRSEARKLGREAPVLSFTPGQWTEQSKKNRGFYLDVLSNSIALIGRKPVVD